MTTMPNPTSSLSVIAQKAYLLAALKRNHEKSWEVTDEKKALLTDLVSMGASWKEMGKALGQRDNTVQSWAKRHRVPGV